MAFQGYPVLGLLVLLGLLTNGIAVSPSYDTASLNRTSFPKGFIFGTASSAYQVTTEYFLYVNLYHSFLQMSRDVKNMINIIMCTCIFFQISSMKVQQMKMVEDQVYGTLSLIDIQVSFLLSPTIWNLKVWITNEILCNISIKINFRKNYFKSSLFRSFHNLFFFFFNLTMFSMSCRLKF